MLRSKKIIYNTLCFVFLFYSFTDMFVFYFLVACLLQVFDSTSKLKEQKTNHFCCIGLSNGGSMQGSAMPVQVPHIRPGSHLESWSLVKMQKCIWKDQNHFMTRISPRAKVLHRVWRRQTQWREAKSPRFRVSRCY